MNRLPLNSVRGRIRAYIESHAGALGDDVLEVGSRIHDPAAWWCTNRDLGIGRWTGIDMQAGEGVEEDRPRQTGDRTDAGTASEQSEVLVGSGPDVLERGEHSTHPG